MDGIIESLAFVGVNIAITRSPLSGFQVSFTGLSKVIVNVIPKLQPTVETFVISSITFLPTQLSSEHTHLYPHTRVWNLKVGVTHVERTLMIERPFDSKLTLKLTTPD